MTAQEPRMERWNGGTGEAIRNEGAASVPGLHKNMRRDFSGCLLRDRRCPFCAALAAHMLLARPRPGGVSGRLFLMAAFGSANTVDTNYGTGPEMTFKPAQECATSTL